MLIFKFHSKDHQQAYNWLRQNFRQAHGEIIVCGPNRRYLEDFAGVFKDMSFPNNYKYFADKNECKVASFSYNHGLCIKFISLDAIEDKICGYRPGCLLLLGADQIPENAKELIYSGFASIC